MAAELEHAIETKMDCARNIPNGGPKPQSDGLQRGITGGEGNKKDSIKMQADDWNSRLSHPPLNRRLMENQKEMSNSRQMAMVEFPSCSELHSQRQTALR